MNTYWKKKYSFHIFKGVDPYISGSNSIEGKVVTPSDEIHETADSSVSSAILASSAAQTASSNLAAASSNIYATSSGSGGYGSSGAGGLSSYGANSGGYGGGKFQLKFKRQNCAKKTNIFVN